MHLPLDSLLEVIFFLWIFCGSHYNMILQLGQPSLLHANSGMLQGLMIGLFMYIITSQRIELKEFEAQKFNISCVAVHPTLPYVLSSADDIKLWNWENDWICTQTLLWHSDSVMQVTFNPTDLKTFASASLDCTIKVYMFFLLFFFLHFSSTHLW